MLKGSGTLCVCVLMHWGEGDGYAQGFENICMSQCVAYMCMYEGTGERMMKECATGKPGIRVCVRHVPQNVWVDVCWGGAYTFRGCCIYQTEAEGAPRIWALFSVQGFWLTCNHREKTVPSDCLLGHKM